ncbi:TPA: hypothetical protein RUV49_002644 [Staphylococcus aureus]|nr:hypothetical protein [Staphylococcus aureus]
MTYNEDIFEIRCKTGDSISEPLHYASMLDADRTYYYLKEQKNLDWHCSNFVVEKINIFERKSKFDDRVPNEKYIIGKLGVLEPLNQGLMTIMVCDILLTIFNREFGYKYNVIINIRDNSRIYDTQKYINPYKRVFPNYKGKFIDSNDERIEVYSNDNDFNYFFPLETREQDIKYYTKLKEEKVNKLRSYLKKFEI